MRQLAIADHLTESGELRLGNKMRQVAMAAAVRAAEATDNRASIGKTGDYPVPSAFQPLIPHGIPYLFYICFLQKIVDMPVQPFFYTQMSFQSAGKAIQGTAGIYIITNWKIVDSQFAYSQVAALL